MRYQLGLNAEIADTKLLKDFSGVGMIRSEYIFRFYDQYITLESCRKKVYDYLEDLCKSTKEQIWYRISDLIVDEVNVLEGCDRIIEEHDYILGLRGIRRGLRFTDTFKLEMEIISRLSNKYSNLNILISYIKDVDEFYECKCILDALGFKNKIGIMAEIPSVLFCLEDFIEAGVSNVTIGLNDLTSLVLGTYRTSGYHDINHKSVIEVIRFCKNICSKYKIPLSVAGILNKEFLRNCDAIGVDFAIINYSQLQELLNYSKEDLPYYDQMKKIKEKTKNQRKIRELNEMRKKIKSIERNMHER